MTFRHVLVRYHLFSYHNLRVLSIYVSNHAKSRTDKRDFMNWRILQKGIVNCYKWVFACLSIFYAGLFSYFIFGDHQEHFFVDQFIDHEPFMILSIAFLGTYLIMNIIVRLQQKITSPSIMEGLFAIASVVLIVIHLGMIDATFLPNVFIILIFASIFAASVSCLWRLDETYSETALTWFFFLIVLLNVLLSCVFFVGHVYNLITEEPNLGDVKLIYIFNTVMVSAGGAGILVSLYNYVSEIKKHTSRVARFREKRNSRDKGIEEQTNE